MARLKIGINTSINYEKIAEESGIAVNKIKEIIELYSKEMLIKDNEPTLKFMNQTFTDGTHLAIIIGENGSKEDLMGAILGIDDAYIIDISKKFYDQTNPQILNLKSDKLNLIGTTILKGSVLVVFGVVSVPELKRFLLNNLMQFRNVIFVDAYVHYYDGDTKDFTNKKISELFFYKPMVSEFYEYENGQLTEMKLR